MLVPGDSGESSGEMGVIWQLWTPVRLPSVGWGTVGRGSGRWRSTHTDVCLPKRGWHHSLRMYVKSATHSHVPPHPVGQVGRNSLGCFGTHGCSLLSARHLNLPSIQMFQHHLGMSLNPKPKLILVNFFKNCFYLRIYTALLSLSCTFYYDFLCIDLSPPLDNGCPGERCQYFICLWIPNPQHRSWSTEGLH